MLLHLIGVGRNDKGEGGYSDGDETTSDNYFSYRHCMYVYAHGSS